PRDKRPNDYANDWLAKKKKGESGSATRKNDTRPEKHNQYTNYTPLNRSKGDIFSVIASELPSPARRKFPYRGREDNNKYRKYHRDYGHHTDDCYQLKEEIEALIRRYNGGSNRQSAHLTPSRQRFRHVLPGRRDRRDLPPSRPFDYYSRDRPFAFRQLGVHEGLLD
ncbi:unnamed protein product, partial [Prunus brigantina]